MPDNDTTISNPGSDGKQPPATETPQSPPDKTGEIAKIIQSETDKVRQELWKEIKKKDAAIDDLKKSQMTESELRKYKESQLQERETLLQRKELELYAVDVLKDSGIPLSLRDFVIGKDQDETKNRANTLKSEFQKAVESAVQDRFKSAGRDPKKADAPAGDKRIYTRAEIDEIGKRAMDRGLSLTDRQKLSDEIKTAALEGRIKA